ncbi:MAG TPA: DUF2007 domain-containing protein [Methylophaga aminisulfidivorans]|uniref:DUF2007 domain-containing protein n=2 Tax=root TaxID=1 RepID=A0A7C1VWG7_9GAMM|nr:DUF2007 domain-containing protein [Methylophaga aminisulfidivorans]
MRLIFRANNILEAHIVAGLLRSRDIDCFVGGHYLQGAVGDLPSTDFAHVFVDDNQYQNASMIIESYENNELPLND